jgi:hypothetical protein
MKYPQDVNISASLYQIRNSVVTIQKDPNISVRRRVAMTNFGMLQQHLSPFVNFSDDFGRSLRVIFGDILKDIFEPPL